MDDEVVCNGNRSGRRLPSWMLPCQKPQAHDLNNNNNNNCSNTESKEGGNDNGRLCKARRPRSKANEKTRKRKLDGDGDGDGDGDDDDDDEEEEEEAGELVRCEERKKRRKRNDNEVAVNVKDNEIPTGKRKRGGKKRRGGKANRDRIDSDDEEEVEGSYIDGDDDLTVEDLMSIAEEYVNVDKEAGQRPSSSKDDLTVEELMSIAKEYVKEDTDVRGKYMSKDEQTAERKVQDVAVSCANKYNRRLSQKEDVDSQCFSNESVAIEETILKPTMSGDPAQDMLDLFLGPLLKRPKNEEKKFNVIAQEISFAHEVQKQKQGVAPGDEAVPLTKKKSSLKDKVAMFLD